MNEFESRVKKGLTSIPGKGFTKECRKEVLRKTANSEPARSKVQKRRWGSVFGRVAAVVIPLGLVSAFGIHLLQSHISNTVASHKTVTTDQQIQDILGKYGWQESGASSSVWITQLPKSYKLQPGKVPIGLYWAYHNTLSKSAGLDMAPYLGQKVKVREIPLKENWKMGPPSESTDAIVITDNGQVIGAWISKAQKTQIVDICESLTHKEFGTITGQTWGNWVLQQKIVDYSDPFYSRMQNWTPKQLMEAYYSAVNKHQYNSAYAMLSTFDQYQTMIMNVPTKHLYHTQWDPQGEGLSNWKTAKFIGMKTATVPTTNHSSQQTAESNLYNDQTTLSKMYAVTFDATLRKVMAMNNGRNTYFTTIVKESSDAPWTISGFATGP